MTRKDGGFKRFFTSTAFAVGAGAWGDSYDHVYSLAREHHQSVVSAVLLPFCCEGPIILGTGMMLLCSLYGKDVPARARVITWAGIVFTVWANLIFGLANGDRTNAVLTVSPVLAFIGCVEALTWMRGNFWGQQKRIRVASPATLSDASAAPGPDASQPHEEATSSELEPVSTPEDELSDRRQRSPRRSAAELCQAAEEEFPAVKNGGEVPTYREIQAAMSLGIPNTKIVYRHLQRLYAEASQIALQAA